MLRGEIFIFAVNVVLITLAENRKRVGKEKWKKDMGNPHPTKSKPNKIGRKHTQGERPHQGERREKGVLIMKKKFEAQRRKMMRKIKKYRDGEIDIFPSM